MIEGDRVRRLAMDDGVQFMGNKFEVLCHYGSAPELEMLCKLCYSRIITENATSSRDMFLSRHRMYCIEVIMMPHARNIFLVSVGSQGKAIRNRAIQSPSKGLKIAMFFNTFVLYHIGSYRKVHCSMAPQPVSTAPSVCVRSQWYSSRSHQLSELPSSCAKRTW